jgi:hypothetical protein
MHTNVILLVISSIIFVLELYEIIVPLKFFQKRGIKFTISLSKILTKPQLQATLDLIDKKKKYHSDERRILIMSCLWQYFLLDLFNAIISVCRRAYLKEIGGCYHVKFNYIDIFEFNINRGIKEDYDSISREDIRKLFLLFALFHEFRHKYQHRNKLPITEYDADRFAFKFAESNREKLKEILGFNKPMYLERSIDNSFTIHIGD